MIKLYLTEIVEYTQSGFVALPVVFGGAIPEGGGRGRGEYWNHSVRPSSLCAGTVL